MQRPAVARALIAGLCATLIGVGFARFAYTPLLPPLIAQHWFPEAAVVFLSAANLAGYLLGALGGRWMAARSSNVAVLRTMQLLVAAAFIACAFPLSIDWFFAWRLLSGIAGGAIVVLVAAAILPSVPKEREGAASGAIFLGVGVGIAASGTLVPALLAHVGLTGTWIGLGVVSLALTLANWTAWPEASHRPQLQVTLKNAPERAARGYGSTLLDVVYGCMAVGLVPPMLFFVDFVARGLRDGTGAASLLWIVYGVGSMCGPLAYGWLTDRFGATRAIRCALLLQIVALAALSVSSNVAVLSVVAFVVGSFPPGIVPLTLGWLREIYPNDAPRQNAKWSRATVVFAASQAVAAYAYSAIFVNSARDYRLLFVIATAAIVVAAALELFVPFALQKKRSRERSA
ncbi:MAG TPA: YbfB/YjiJ family MFS transporter [Candidatus Tumulicola sp.]|jgi:predicted MFS family arabinose efflux permease